MFSHYQRLGIFCSNTTKVINCALLGAPYWGYMALEVIAFFTRLRWYLPGFSTVSIFPFVTNDYLLGRYNMSYSIAHYTIDHNFIIHWWFLCATIITVMFTKWSFFLILHFLELSFLPYCLCSHSILYIRMDSWIFILQIIICYYHLFICSSCLNFWHWDLLQTGSSVLSTCPHHFFEHSLPGITRCSRFHFVFYLLQP